MNTEIIGRMQSAKSASRMLEQIAVAGHYTAKSFDNSFVVYVRHSFGLIEEITIKKLGQRRFEIVKTTTSYPLDELMKDVRLNQQQS